MSNSPEKTQEDFDVGGRRFPKGWRKNRQLTFCVRFWCKADVKRLLSMTEGSAGSVALSEFICNVAFEGRCPPTKKKRSVSSFCLTPLTQPHNNQRKYDWNASQGCFYANYFSVISII